MTTPNISGCNLLRLPAVMAITGMSESTLRREVEAKSFPKPVMLSKRLVAWRHVDVQAWVDSRPPKPTKGW